MTVNVLVNAKKDQSIHSLHSYEPKEYTGRVVDKARYSWSFSNFWPSRSIASWVKHIASPDLAVDPS